jgi:hypothetical protein
MDQFAKLDGLPSSVVDQITKSSIGKVNLTSCGLFADLSTSSEAIYSAPNKDERCFLAQLVAEKELADVILFIENGKIDTLEISVYLTPFDWEQFRTAKVCPDRAPLIS